MTMQSLPVRLSRRHGSLTPPGSPLADPTPGSLRLTAHHLVFQRDDSKPASRVAPEGQLDDGGDDKVWIPLGLLHSVTRTPPTLTGEPTPLVVRTRDYLTYELAFDSTVHFEHAWDSLKAQCGNLSAGGLEGKSAFAQPPPRGTHEERAVGWDVYDVEAEFARMGMGIRSKAWRFTDINRDFQASALFCPSYPAKIVVPAKISDTTLSYAVKYRSKSRIPGLVYLHWANLGSITRSSQPMVGITQNARSIQDEKLIEAIFTSHSQHSHALPPMQISDGPLSPARDGTPMVYGATPNNIIIDARPTKNAYANSVKGAGTENMLYYRHCKKEYLGIDNIHVMRSSLNGVLDALADAEATGTLDRATLRRTNWLAHLTNILDGVLIVVRTVHLYNSHVLVHCSDGWDRTSQLSALPQLCLDPYFRTARGFAVLIEKDWISYGHRFADRSGHLCNDRVDFITKLGTDASTQQAFLASVTRQFAGSGSSHAFKETCPVFQQFLDCVYQIMRQYPTRFEFNERLLRHLVRETYGDGCGSFLFNSERDRAELGARQRTRSVWETVFEPVSGELRTEFRNAGYDPARDDPARAQRSGPGADADADQGVLLPDAHDVRWWYELFGRDDDEMNARPFPAAAAAAAGAGVGASETGTATEVRVVTGLDDDPVLNGLTARTGAWDLAGGGPEDELASPSRKFVPAAGAAPMRDSVPVGADDPSVTPSSARSPSPTATRADLLSQQQLTETVASVQKLGWSAWKSMRKFGEEAARQLKEQQQAAAARTAAAAELEQREMSGSGNDGRGSPGGESASGGMGGTWSSRAGGMWGKLSSTTNPWAAGTEADPLSGGRAPASTSSFPATNAAAAPLRAPTYDPTTTTAYKTYQPRQQLAAASSVGHGPPPSQPAPRPAAAAPAPAAPVVPARQPSSSLSINPWETISREEAVPSTAVSSSAPSPLVTPVHAPSIEREEPLPPPPPPPPHPTATATDPLGVGFA